jgi:hypothetical protein
MRSDEELRRVLARPDLPWPDETGAYERFLRRRARRGRVVAATAGLALVAVLGAAVLVARQPPPEREPAAAQSVLDPRPHQWVYTKSLTVEHWNRKNGKPLTHERWVRVDGRKFVNQQHNDPRAAHTKKVRKERVDFPSLVSARWPRCPPGKREQLARIRPAVGLAAFFPNPAAVPSDPDGLLAAVYQLVQDPDCAPIRGDNVQDRAFHLIGAMLHTVQPPEVRAALYQALARIPGVTVAHGASDAAGRRGVAFVRAASLVDDPGSSDRFRLELILDNDSYRYLGARYVVTRDHVSEGTRYRKGQVFLSRAQLALAVVDAPCQRPGETTTCASYVEASWVGG